MDYKHTSEGENHHGEGITPKMPCITWGEKESSLSTENHRTWHELVTAYWILLAWVGCN